MGKGAIAIEGAASIAVLLFFGVAGAIPGIAPNQANEMTGTPASGLMFAAGIGSQLLVNAVIALLILRHCRGLTSRLGSLHFAGALAGFAVLSAFWSQDPVLSARRAIPFVLATIFGLYLARRGTLRQQLALFERSFVLLALASVVVALGFPSLGLDASTGHAGNWQGVFTQKNACGRAMVFASAVALAQGRLNGRRAASLFLFLAILVLSGSRGAWAIEAGLLVLAAGQALLARFRPEPRRWLAGGALGAGVLSLVLGRLFFAELALMLGRDPTLTGRTGIWAQVWIEILKRPWLGYGFSAFWRGTKGASFEVVVALKFVLFHAHNGFLEIWLELGAAGLLLFLLSYLRGCWQLRPVLWSGCEETGMLSAAWPLYVLFLILAYDLDENTLLSFNGLFWVLYVHALVSLQPASAASARMASARELDGGLASMWYRTLQKCGPSLAEGARAPRLGFAKPATGNRERTLWF